ncbi:hypothetical protein FACS189426_06300 [Bacteroidia bacterium]|nr:hypothetical protein FACS189426_06300 [Bacteroidia bacterium]GHV71213.1 hypothetical protein FACS189420_5470 [Bacteroidia bacterium]
METEKVQIVLGENVTKAEVILREGASVKEIEPKATVKTNLSGVIGVPVEYLTKRVATGQFTQERSIVIVNREEIRLSLVINEDDEYLRGQVDGTLEFHPKFIEFGINTGKVWTPTDLGLFFKMNRAFFPDKNTNMKLVTDLMNFSATVSNKIDRMVKENGDRTDNFAQVVNSNLPASFVLEIPIFKGVKAETLEIETFAKINGREVSFTLLSPGANQALEEIRDKVIDSQLESIKEIAPNIAIIEV